MKTLPFLILLLLGMGILSLFLFPQRLFFHNKINNFAGLIKEESIKTDNQVKNDFSNAPKADSGLKKQVKADLSLQRAFLFEKGKLVKEYAISSGKASTPTPLGHFNIVYKSPKIYSRITQCWLSFWAGFTSDGKYGFHETPVCNGQRQGEDMIEQPASSGCLRLKIGDAEAFYDWVEEGTSIDIY